MDADPETVRLLAEEYFHLQNTIEAFDEKALGIKEWGTGISVAIVALALKLSNRWIASLAAINAIGFWLIESMWKLFQWSYMGRIWEIETFFRANGSTDPIAPLQITRYWLSQWQGGDQLDDWDWRRDKWLVFIEKFLDFNVFMPYLVIVVLVVLMILFWNWFGSKP